MSLEDIMCLQNVFIIIFGMLIIHKLFRIEKLLKENISALRSYKRRVTKEAKENLEKGKR